MNRAERRRTARDISDAHAVPFTTALAAVNHGVYIEVIALALAERDLVKRRQAFIAATNALIRRERR